MENSFSRQVFFEKVSIDYCRQHGICLSTDESGVERFAVRRNTKPFVVDVLRRFIGIPLACKTTEPTELELLINQQYESFQVIANESERLNEAQGSNSKLETATLAAIDDENDLLHDQSAAPVIELVNRILFDAV